MNRRKTATLSNNNDDNVSKRLERRIEALEQVVILLSKIAKVDISKFVKTSNERIVTEAAASSLFFSSKTGHQEEVEISQDGLKPSSNSTFRSTVFPPQFSVKKLRITVRSEGSLRNKGIIIPTVHHEEEKVQVLQDIPETDNHSDANDDINHDFSNSPENVLPEPVSPEQPQDIEEDHHSDDDDDGDYFPNSSDSENSQNGGDIEEEEDYQQEKKISERAPEPKRISNRVVNKSPSPVAETEDKDKATFQCPYCELTFPFKNHLTRHKQENHKRVGLKTCPHCNKKVYGAVKFSEHLRVHTGERPFLCSYCGYAAKCKGSLNKHVKMAHEGGFGTFLCKYCGKEFKSTSLRRIHEKTHENSGDICPICKGTFVKVKEHIKKVHTKIRKYECHLCDHKFVQAHNLKRHVATHANPNRRIKSYHVERPEKGPKKGKRTVLRIFERDDVEQDTVKAGTVNQQSPMKSPATGGTSCDNDKDTRSEHVGVDERGTGAENDTRSEEKHQNDVNLSEV